jgi:hypothetical protein
MEFEPHRRALSRRAGWQWRNPSGWPAGRWGIAQLSWAVWEVGAGGLAGAFSSHWGMAIPPGLDTDRKAFLSGRLKEALGWIVKGQVGVDPAHLPFAAGRTETPVDAFPFQECFQVDDVGTLRIDPSEQGAAGGEFFPALAVDEEAVIADAPKLRRQDMGEETAKELLGGQVQGLLDFLLLLAIVQVGKGDDAPIDALDAVVGDGDAVDIAPEVTQQVLGLEPEQPPRVSGTRTPPENRCRRHGCPDARTRGTTHARRPDWRRGAWRKPTWRGAQCLELRLPTGVAGELRLSGQIELAFVLERALRGARS